MSTLIVESRRGNLVESVHRVSAVVTDAAGKIIARTGDPEFPTFLRSAAKPFQAMPLVAEGAADRFALTSEELALACASHNSEPEQVERVRLLLQRVGCVEDDLACGPHRPLWRDMALSSETKGITDVPRTRLASNCSGKHTGMLALARHAGWPTAGYEKADHPVQQHCQAAMATWAGLSQSQMGVAVDGCGVRCFAMPLSNMARAFAKLVTAPDAVARRIVHAMTTHPDLVAGRGRLCTMLMKAYPGEILAKVGAEGVYGAALIDRGVGIALKIEDGDGWSACLALIRILEQLGVDSTLRERLAPFAEVPLRNTRGEVVGALQSSGSLTFV